MLHITYCQGLGLRCAFLALQIDTQVLDFGIVSVGFRYTLDFVVHNTCAIPMRFTWAIPQDTGEHKEFTVSKATLAPTLQLCAALQDCQDTTPCHCDTRASRSARASPCSRKQHAAVSACSLSALLHANCCHQGA